jgi:drug/metabolite transporter (DMT)-like permease
VRCAYRSGGLIVLPSFRGNEGSIWIEITGSLGFAAFNLLAYTGLAHARPQSASLIVALAPLLTALVLWRRTGVRPSGLGAAELPELSALRYTALTASLGWITLAAATAGAIGSGLVALPSAHQVWSVTPQIAYLSIPGAFLAVLTWNAAIGLIGPQNAALFGNLIRAANAARGARAGQSRVDELPTALEGA